MKINYAYLALFFILFNCANIHTTTAAESSCAITNFGECCVVKISPTEDATVHTTIDATKQVDFVVFTALTPKQCEFQYLGDPKLNLRFNSDGFAKGIIGTWLGGDFRLHYMKDATNLGSCQMIVSYMNTMNMRNGFPRTCLNGKFYTKQTRGEPAMTPAIRDTPMPRNQILNGGKK